MPSVPTGGWKIVLAPAAMLGLFTVVNILNYVDRGIVPGAFGPLGDYIRADIHQNDTDTYTGILQSSFIGGYSVASISFGHMVHTYPPFRLMAVGLAIWTVAVLLSGLAPYIITGGQSFWFLVFARVLSGVGEASFQIVVPPYIDDNAPPAKRGLWLAIFYMAIPVGTAIGYGYGGFVGGRLSWEWAFIMEAIPMAPLIVIIWFVPYNRLRREVIAEVEDALDADAATKKLSIEGELNQDGKGKGRLSDTTPLLSSVVSPRKTSGLPEDASGRKHPSMSDLSGSDPKHPHLRVHSDAHYPHHVPPTKQEVEREVNEELIAKGDSAALQDVSPGHPSFLTELKGVFTNPIYMCIVLGYAAFTGVVAGVGTFAPAFIVGFGLAADTETASLAAGAMAASAGILGVPIGGWFIDRGQRKARERIRLEQKVRDQAKTMGLDEDAAVAQAFKPKSFFDLPMPTIFSRATTPPSTLTSSLTEGEGLASPEGVLPAEETEAESTSPQVMDMKLVVSLFQAAALVFLGTVIMIAAVFTTNSSLPVFLSVLAIGTLILMGTTAGINLAMMAAVPPESRSFAIGLGTLMLHALGDVPAPPIIGAMADRLSPNICDANNNCHRDHSGLVDTLLATASWLAWPVFFWTLAYILAVRRQAFRRRTGFYRLFSSTPGGDRDRDVPPPYVAPSRSPPNFTSSNTNSSGTSYGIGMPLPRIPSSRYEDSSLNLGISISSSLANTNYLTDAPGLEMKPPSRPNSATHSASYR